MMVTDSNSRLHMQPQSKSPLNRRRATLVLLAAILSVFPATAQAHSGPADPIASSYLAKLQSAPPGTVAQVLGGDQRLWLQVDPAETLIVFDDRGAPYLRFYRAGVDVNRNSSMYYLNLANPVTPPRTLPTRPDWERATLGHVYSWHDGRLHALASVALAPGSAYVGRWTIPALVDGRSGAFTGVLLHTARPSIVWFWPIAVILLCVAASWRIRRSALDTWGARALAVGVLIALTVGAAGRQLYGRPTVTASQLIVLALILAFVAAMAIWLSSGRLGFLSLLLIGLAAIGQGIEFVPTLVNGYVFTTLPNFVARVTTVVCLSAGPALLLLAFRAPEQVGASAHRASDREQAVAA